MGARADGATREWGRSPRLCASRLLASDGFAAGSQFPGGRMGEPPRQMESLVTDPAFWRGKKIFLTGHTGFKGAWASLLLRRLGASVYGYALPPTHQSALFVTARIVDDIKHHIADIRDLPALRAAMVEAEPDIVIHMAAQALVRPSYEEPVETFATNLMGTVHVLEAARQLRSVQVILNVTSDKCYENNGKGVA